MQIPLYLLLPLWSLSIFISDYQAIVPPARAHTKNLSLYIYAPSGLNMREGPNVSYNVLTKIPYGAKVELLTPAKDKELNVDGLAGGMAKIQYNGYIGYAFDGYMTQFQVPEKEVEVKNYLELLRNQGHLVYYEKVERDYDGYFQYEESLTLHKSSWREAFLVAKELFDIPPKLIYPTANSSTAKQINPDKSSVAWTDELLLTVENYAFKDITYSYRAEATGKVVGITKGDGGDDAFKITNLLIAD